MSKSVAKRMGPSDDPEPMDTESVMGNEDQDPTLSREIRASLQELLTETKRNTAALVTGDVSGVQGMLQQSAHIFQNVKKSSEAALDAKVIHSVAEIGNERARKMMTDMNNFNVVEFARIVRRGIITSYSQDDEAEDDNDEVDESSRISNAAFVRFGQNCQIYLKQSPALTYMFGSFERGPPPARVPPKIRVKESQKEKLISTAPKQLKSFDEMERKETTTIEVDKIHQLLRKVYKENNNNPLCYFEFVINPHSFEQSVENIFYASFLLKDGFAKVFHDDDQLPVIVPVDVKHKKTSASTDASVKNNSYILSLSREKWKNIVEVFQLTSGLIETRPVRHQRLLKHKFRPAAMKDSQLSYTSIRSSPASSISQNSSVPTRDKAMKRARSARPDSPMKAFTPDNDPDEPISSLSNHLL